MSPSDALFAVRVVHDGQTFWGALWGVCQPLIGVIAGGLITYGITRGSEDRKQKRETYALARSLVAELRASQHIRAMQAKFAQEAGVEAAEDTLRYGRASVEVHPVARAAAAAAGQFEEPVAIAVTKFAFLLHNVVQQVGVLSEMHKAGTLSPEKFQQRVVLLVRPIIEDLIMTADALLESVEKHYPSRTRA